MFCKNCGKELPDTAKFCMVCGTPIGELPKSDNCTKKKFFSRITFFKVTLSGVISDFILGIIAVFYALITYSNDTSGLFGYTYQPPYSDHEIMTMLIGFCGFVFLISGAIELRIYLKKNKLK